MNRKLINWINEKTLAFFLIFSNLLMTVPDDEDITANYQIKKIIY